MPSTLVPIRPSSHLVALYVPIPRRRKALIPCRNNCSIVKATYNAISDHCPIVDNDPRWHCKFIRRGYIKQLGGIRRTSDDTIKEAKTLQIPSGIGVSSELSTAKHFTNTCRLQCIAFYYEQFSQFVHLGYHILTMTIDHTCFVCESDIRPIYRQSKHGKKSTIQRRSVHHGFNANCLFVFRNRLNITNFSIYTIRPYAIKN